MFVLIVKEDVDQITKCMHGIKTCLQTVRPHITVQHRSLLDLSGDRSKIKCDKVLFLLSSKSASIDIAETEWVAKLQKIRHDSDYIIIRFGISSKRVLGNSDGSKRQETEIIKNDAVQEIPNTEKKKQTKTEAENLSKAEEETMIQDTVKKVLIGVKKNKFKLTNEMKEISDDNTNEIVVKHEREVKKTDSDSKDNTEDNVSEARGLEEESEGVTEEVSSDIGNHPKSRRKNKGKQSKKRNKGKMSKANKVDIDVSIKQNVAEEIVNEIESTVEKISNNVCLDNDEVIREYDSFVKKKTEKIETVAGEDSKETNLVDPRGTVDNTEVMPNENRKKIKEDTECKADNKKESFQNEDTEKEKVIKDKTSERAVKIDEKQELDIEVKANQKHDVKNSAIVSLFRDEKTTSSDKVGNDETYIINNSKYVDISNFEKELFKWWPNILVFLFGKTNMSTWMNKKVVPTKHIYCLHYFPDRKETVHPITRHVLTMLQNFGARKTQSHNEDKQCCLLVCKEAGTHLPLGAKSQLVKSSKDVHVFAIALQGSHFSEDLASSVDRCFTNHSLMSLILVLLTELNLITVNLKNHGKANRKSGERIPAFFYYFIAHLVFLFNIPALLIHLSTSAIYLWPIFIIFSSKDADEKVRYINYGMIISAVVTILTVILTEISLYPDFFVCPISVPVSVYLIIWQVGVGINLQVKYNYKYGIFSIPSQLLSKA